MFKNTKLWSLSPGVLLRKRGSTILAAGIALVLVLSACTSATPTAAPQPTTAPTQPLAPAATNTAAPAPAATNTAAPAPAATNTTAQAPTPAGPVAVLPTPAASEPAAIANLNTPVLSGPGSQYPVYGWMAGGQSAKVTGVSQDKSYWVVSIPIAPQGQGWVSAADVQVTNASNVPVVPTPPVLPAVTLSPPGPTDPSVTTLAAAYVRSGPGDTYPAYGVAETGKSGFVLGVSQDGKWWAVRINPDVVGTGFGWVSAEWVQAANTQNVPVIQAPPPPAPVTLPPPASGVPTAMAVDYVNLRSGPGTNYTVYGVAAPGATSEVTGKSSDGQWWVVKVPTSIAANGQAWVSASYVTTTDTASVPVVQAPPAPPAVTPTPPTSTGATGTALEPINIRSGPSSQYPSYGVVPAGTSGQIVGKNSDGSWWAVALPTSVAPVGYGWVSAAYVTTSNTGSVPVMPTTPPPSEVPVATPLPSGAVAVALEPINVRSGPGSEYPSYGVAPAGASAQITGVSSDGQWWVVQIPTTMSTNGQGWVSGAYVQVSNASGVPVVPPPPPPSQLPAPAPTPQPGGAYGVAIDTINVRSGPGNQYTSYGVVSPGASAPIIGKSSDGTWWVMQIPTSVAANGQGWVSASYVQATNAQDVPVIEAPPAP